LSLSLSRISQNDPDLALILERWPTLPEAIRAGILAMINAAACRRRCCNSDSAPRR
jgi:hypothetical protein